MNALVTGGTGFLGQHLARRLLELGYTVRVLGRNTSIGNQLKTEGMQFIPLDLTDAPALMEACRGQSLVFHCGALSAPWGKERDFYNANVLGTRHLTQGCQKFGVSRLIHVSSPSIYFDGQDCLNIREDAPLPNRAVNFYAHTKRLAEIEIDNAFRSGLPVVTIRPRALFGPGDHTILPRLIRANQRLGVPFINLGKALIDVTYIDNAVDALLCCIDSPESTLGHKYNVSNGTPTTVAALMHGLFGKLGQELRPLHVAYPVAHGLAALLEGLSHTVLLGREPLFTRYSMGVLAKSQTLDISRTQMELGYQPKITIEEGLEKFAVWWKEQSSDN